MADEKFLNELKSEINKANRRLLALEKFTGKEYSWAGQKLYDELNKEFNFTLDPCCTEENHKCSTYYTKEDNGLQKEWGGVHSLLQPTLPVEK